MTLRWHHYDIGDLLLPDERDADKMPVANARYLRSIPPGHTITSSRMEPKRGTTGEAEQVYILWQRKEHVATLRVPAHDDGARRAAVADLQRRAEGNEHG